MGCSHSAARSSSAAEVFASEHDLSSDRFVLRKTSSALFATSLQNSTQHESQLPYFSPSPPKVHSEDQLIQHAGQNNTNTHTPLSPPILKRRLSRSASLTPTNVPTTTIFNGRVYEYPHKEQFDFLGLFFIRDVLSFFSAYKKIVIAEKMLEIEDMDIEDEGIGARQILMHQMLNSDSLFGGPVKIGSILKYFNQQDNKFLRLVFNLHCVEKHIVKNQISFKMFVIILWNYCTQNQNSLAEYAFGLYDHAHSGAMSTAKFERMIKVLVKII